MQKVTVEKCLPIIDILTLSATGSEMDCGGVISNPESFTEIGIEDTNFSVMAKKACWSDVLPGFKPLNQQDIENIFKMCM